MIDVVHVDLLPRKREEIIIFPLNAFIPAGDAWFGVEFLSVMHLSKVIVKLMFLLKNLPNAYYLPTYCPGSEFGKSNLCLRHSHVCERDDSPPHMQRVCSIRFALPSLDYVLLSALSPRFPFGSSNVDWQRKVGKRHNYSFD